MEDIFVLSIKKFNLIYKNKIFENANVNFYNSCIHAIIGDSGSGKTSFFRNITDGDSQNLIIEFDNNLITDKNEFIRNHVAYVTQTGDYFPNMTIEQHFKFYAQMFDKEITDSEIINYLDRVNLNGINIKKHPYVLSLGERKRFLIALALYCDKDIIILDEPTASLDETNIDKLMEVLSLLKDKMVIISTHDHKILEICSVIYKISDLKFKCIKNEHIEKNQNKKQHNYLFHPFLYLKFKNYLLKILFMIMIITGIFIVYQTSVGIEAILNGLEINPIVTSTPSKTKIFIRNRKGPADIVYVPGVHLEQAQPFTQEQLNEISSIKGVKALYTTDMISTYNGNENNEVIIKHSDNTETQYSKDDNIIISICPYFSEDNLDNKIYANFIFKDLGLNNGDILTSSFYIPVKQYNLDDENSNDYRMIAYTCKEISYKIDNILPEDKSTSNPLSDFIIYVPFEQFKLHFEEVRDSDNLIESNYLSFIQSKYPSQEYTFNECVVYVDESFVEDIYYQIMNIDEQFDVSNIYMNYLEIDQMIKTQNKSEFLSLSIIFLIGVSAFSAMYIFYINYRKKEFLLLKCNGIEISEIQKTLFYEQILLFSILGCISFLFMFMNISRLTTSLVVLACVFVLAIICHLIKKFYFKTMISKM